MTIESDASRLTVKPPSPKPVYYHCHVYFDDRTAEKADGVYRLASSNQSIEAVGRFHLHPIGPHPCRQFQLLVRASKLSEVMEWLLRYRNGLDVLVHPDIEDDYAAHTTYAQWLGNAHCLSLDLFKGQTIST